MRKCSSFLCLAVLAPILCLAQPFAHAQAIETQPLPSALDALQSLGQNTGYIVTQSAQVLKGELALGALEMAQILAHDGYGATEVGRVLLGIRSLDIVDAIQILGHVGFSDEEVDRALQILAYPIAEMHAPQLWFDHNASTFPMSAQDYYDVVISYYFRFGFWPEGLPYHNQDPTTVTKNEIPTYYRAFICGERQIRIAYWWFYGWQPPCYAQQGSHHGDWEHIIVILDEDVTGIAAVIFFQHGGWYTMLSGYPTFQDDVGTHPIVHVGKKAHGSYHNECYLRRKYRTRPNSVLPYECRYFGDFRSNRGREDLRLDCWEKLVVLDQDIPTEPWMEADANIDFTWGPDGVSTHPTRLDTDEVCNMSGCKGDDCLSQWGKTQGCCVSQVKGTIPTTDEGLGLVFTQYVQVAPANSLLQNYPNPFNPETWIPYQLAEDVGVAIRIYDVAGRVIRTLGLGYRPAGFYTTKDKAAYWDGRNEAGEQVAAGVYFYTIQAGEFTATKKMVVAR